MVPDDYTSHRANADTLTCAILLEFLVDYALETNQLVESPSLGEDLHELCWSPIKIKTWPFGKHKGKLLSEIDKDYYRWGLENLNALNKTHIDYNADLTAAVLEQLKSP
jgi:hypothetical protein